MSVVYLFFLLEEDIYKFFVEVLVGNCLKEDFLFEDLWYIFENI